MKAPSDFGAVKLERMPVDLTFVRDLEEFDGPLLSEFKSAEGETFLYHWCDCNAQSNRWLVVRTPRQDLYAYLVGQVTLRKLIRDCRDRFLYVLDIGGDAETLAAWFAQADRIPEVYLPTPQSKRRVEDTVESGFQDVYVGEKWDYEQVTAYPRRYLQTYSFHTAFGAGGDPKTLTVNYHLTKGFVFHTLFEKMRTNAPTQLRASLEAVSFASPGYLRFTVAPAVATGVRDAVSRYLQHAATIHSDVETIRDWSNARIKLSEATIEQIILRITELVGVDGKAVIRHVDQLGHAAKLVAAYFGRLAFLATNETGRSAMLVGLERSEEQPPDR
jgi:hypothetical protein